MYIKRLFIQQIDSQAVTHLASQLFKHTFSLFFLSFLHSKTIEIRIVFSFFFVFLYIYNIYTLYLLYTVYIYVSPVPVLFAWQPVCCLSDMAKSTTYFLIIVNSR